MKELTINEIAKLAGVSKTTVSRVLNNKPDVKSGTRELINNIITQYGFQPNAFAKAISHQRSHTIGLVIPYKAHYIFSNQFYADVINGVSTEITQSGYYLLLCYAYNDNFIDMFKQKRVEGFIVISPGSYHKDIIDKINEAGALFVATSRVLGEQKVRYVDIDNFYAATLAIEHLISLGHRHIGFISNIGVLTSSEERLLGYKEVLGKYQIPYQQELIREGDGSIDSGYLAMSDLLRNEKLTAVFISGDTMAAGAVKAIKEQGKKVPGDISVVGFDDLPLAQVMTPMLTTIRQSGFDRGNAAAKMLLDILESKQTPDNLTLPVSLVVRDSSNNI